MTNIQNKQIKFTKTLSRNSHPRLKTISHENDEDMKLWSKCRRLEVEKKSEEALMCHHQVFHVPHRNSPN